MEQWHMNRLSNTELARYYDSMDFERRYTYDGSDLGSTYTPEKTTWKIWSPLADAVEVRLYTRGSDSEEGASFRGAYACDSAGRGVWSLSLEGDYHGIYYTYGIVINGNKTETADLYGKASGVNGWRSMVVDLKATNPPGWEQDHRISCEHSTDAIIWETHVRDFSESPSSGMVHRGQYLAFTETDTTVNGEGMAPTGISYLNYLGITHVHLLPVFDYATVDERDGQQYNWGYDPLQYNVPEGSYASDPFDGAVRIQEFKAMVQALHRAGIGVVLDVVFNHTFFTEESAFHKTMPYYYHRTNLDGSFSNGSMCGNETACERTMCRRFILDSILYWTTEYHIDGFRFDLMGIHDVDFMNQIRGELDRLPLGKSILMYGEPWTAGQIALRPGLLPAVKGNARLLNERIAIFNDDTRDAIKGNAFSSDTVGFINGGWGMEEQIRRSIRAWAGTTDTVSLPTQTISYTSAHDNYTLWDKLTATINDGILDYDHYNLSRIAANKLAAALILTSQGIPFFLAGEEFARTKWGDHNSYCSESRVNALDWNRTNIFREIVEYYRGLIQIRKQFSAFRDPTGESIQQIYFSAPQDQVVAYTLEGKPQDAWPWIAVILNASLGEREVMLETWQGKTLPERWMIIADEKSAGLTPISYVEGNRMRVPRASVTIAAGCGGP